MRNEKNNLRDLGYPVKGGEFACYLADYPLDDPLVGGKRWKRPAVIVVPGGGYAFTSKREEEHVATYFLAKGFQAFSLNYLVKPDGVSYPEQLIELGSAVDYIKKHAEEFHVNPDEIFVVGFSAGGHLTANLAVDYKSVPALAGAPLDCKPRGVCLSYPVINYSGHPGSFHNLLGGYNEEEKNQLMEELSLDQKVDEDTVPCFIWTSAKDDCVDPRNSIDFARACATNGVPFTLHVYPFGGHGVSTDDLEVNEERFFNDWLEDCMAFFRLFTVEKF